MLSLSAAQAACLGIAQIIPTLLVALFVIDRTRFGKVSDAKELEDSINRLRGHVDNLDALSEKLGGKRSEVKAIATGIEKELKQRLSARQRRELRTLHAEIVSWLHQDIDPLEPELAEAKLQVQREMRRYARSGRFSVAVGKAFGSIDSFTLALTITFACCGEFLALMGAVSATASAVRPCLMVAIWCTMGATLNLVSFIFPQIAADAELKKDRFYAALYVMLNVFLILCLLAVYPNLRIKG